MSEFGAIVMNAYVDGLHQGKSDLMRPAFHSGRHILRALSGRGDGAPLEPLINWIDHNGPAQDMQARVWVSTLLSLLGSLAV